MIIAIDFSINSTGICLYNEDGIHFLSIARNTVASSDFFNILAENQIHITNLTKYKSCGTSSIDERGYTRDAIQLAYEISELIKTVNKGKGDSEKNIIIFEGFSFGSKGNRLAQISGYQYILRDKLSDLLNFDNLYVYAPQSVKSTAGCAGRGKNKKDMITAFREHDELLPKLKEHVFYKNIISNPELFQTKKTKRGGGKFRKPIDDLVDSYWILKTFLKKENYNISDVYK